MTSALAPGLPARGFRWRRVLVLGLCALLGTGLLVGLGVWQLERLKWKLSLIQAVESRVLAPAHAPPTSAAQDPSAHEYEHVEVEGTFLRGFDTWVHASTERGAGYWILSPFRMRDGGIVLINRGFVSSEVPRMTVSDDESDHVTGLLRLSERGQLWPRRDEPLNDRWYARDIPAIAAARGLQGVLPYFIDAQPNPVNPASRNGDDRPALVRPVAGLTVVHFRNTHLSYALTWFALAFMTLGAGTYTIRAELHGHARHH